MTTEPSVNPTIVRTSPAPETKTSFHPRRPQPNQSVSLLHSRGSRPSSLSASSSDSGKAQRPAISPASSTTHTPSSLQANGGKNSSGGETSNAENWFDKSNNEVRDNSAAFDNDDPPFFLRNSSSESPPDALNPDLQHAANTYDRANSLPLRTELLQLGTEGSSVEDYRGVIDDLTVENQKLKRRLKKYEKYQDSSLKDDKLFEVRIHGLPPEKKKELEETLQKFAASLGTAGANAFPVDGYASLLPMLKGGKTASSQTSAQNADSAYASMSASGQGSSAQSGADGKRKGTPTQFLATRSQNIHSYLHDIPEGLQPRQNPSTMSERAKEKLVVRRMEHIFAGKGAASAGHQQSLQQQEVSQTAAQIDRSALEAQGQRAGREGSREAHIMKRRAERQMEAKQFKGEDRMEVDCPEQRARTQPTGRSPNPEQRPTRPLDLDPHRAQIASDNIDYMRQMGFSPQDAGSNASLDDGHGWIYLNFLINMAQLHTINVTAEFVRKALGDYSNKFEISQDRRKVRWKGGRSVTRNSSSGGGSSNERASDETPDQQSPRKRVKLNHTGSAQSNATRGVSVHGLGGRVRSESNKHMYTPLFHHKDSTDDTDNSSSEAEQDSEESPPYSGALNDSSGMTSSGIRTSSGVPAPAVKKKQKRDDGPIIFYNNARFCTDLSGERKPKGPQGNRDGPLYTTTSSMPVGQPVGKSTKALERRGPLAQASNLPEPMDLSDNPIPESMEISFPPDSPTKSASSKGQEPIDLEVTGIGGVWPADNFSISVRSQHAITQSQVIDPSRQVETKSLPPRVAQILEKSGITPKTHAIVDKHFVASAVRGLPPSELPEALNYMPFEDESLEDDSDDEDDASEAPSSPGAYPPATAPQRVDFQYALSDDEDEDSEDEDDEDDDGEVDFLAAARQMDPQAVLEKEREYDANMAERLAEDIPAGSSAATAGGGSGFASPASGVNKEEARRAMREARAKAALLKRTETSDSLEQNQSPSDDDDGDEGMSDVRS